MGLTSYRRVTMRFTLELRIGGRGHLLVHRCDEGADGRPRRRHPSPHRQRAHEAGTTRVPDRRLKGRRSARSICTYAGCELLRADRRLGRAWPGSWAASGAQRSRELLLARNGISGTLTKRADRRSSRTSTWRLGRPEDRLLDMPRWRRERSAPRCTEADMCAAFAMSADCGARSTSAPWPSSRAEPVGEECIVEGLAASTVVRAQVDLDLPERVVDRRDHTEAVFDRYRARLRSPAPWRRSASATPSPGSAGTGSGGPGRSSSTTASASRSAAAHLGGKGAAAAGGALGSGPDG